MQAPSFHPNRAAPASAAAPLAGSGTYAVLNAADHEALVPSLVDLAISGGAANDAPVGLKAAGVGATVLSCDHRAALT